MTNRYIHLLFSLAIILLLGVGCTASGEPRTLEQGLTVLNLPSEQEAALRGLEFTTLDGERASLVSYDGVPLIVNSWASWCLFCTTELPELAAAQRELGDAVRIIAINRSESADVVQNFLADIADADALTFFQDQHDLFYQEIGGFTMPETLFLRADGSLMLHKRGVLNAEQTMTLAHQLLEESAIEE